MVDWSEFHAGLAETRRYLLSHHEPADYDRTYLLTLGGRRARLCARCSGVYPGILAGLAAGIVDAGPLAVWSLLLVLPLPALVDWTATRFTDRRGYNAVRTASGFLLGYAYGLGLVLLALDGDRRVLLVGGAYGLAAAVLLAVRFRQPGAGSSDETTEGTHRR